MNKSDLRIVFMGTPDFALPSLTMLVEEGYDVALVVAQPDRKRGRGHKLLPPPTKVCAQEHGLEVFQVEKISSPEGVAKLKEVAPNLMITAAFGQILSEEVLGIPSFGCINVHGSLLPKYRGAAPIQWAIINGERESGVTTMYTVKKLDAGDMLLKQAVPIGDETTAGELYEQLAQTGAQVLKKTLEQLLNGTLCPTPQQEEDMTYFPMFPKGFGQIDFAQPAQNIKNLVRGINPAPGAYTFYEEQKIKVFAVSVLEQKKEGTPGQIIAADAKQGLIVCGGDGLLSIDTLQFPGSRPMSAADFLRGKQLQVGTVLK